MERVVIFGPPGCGKTTLAMRLRLPLVHRDSLGRLGSPEYLASADIATQAQRWVFDGPPFYVDGLVYERADTLLIIDFPKRIVMFRVLRRSLGLLIPSRHIGGHPSRGLRSWAHADHPIRVAWTQFGQRRVQVRELVEKSGQDHLSITVFHSPRELEAWLTLGPRQQDHR